MQIPPIADSRSASDRPSPDIPEMGASMRQSSATIKGAERQMTAASIYRAAILQTAPKL